uniref:Sororin-like middle region domain-containing protein n=1 Tax=Glossina brevipalpis TaxID=37001 RepID=A0A1A9WPG5_9MUSC
MAKANAKLSNNADHNTKRMNKNHKILETQKQVSRHRNAPITVKTVHKRKGEKFTKSPQVLRKCLVRLKRINIGAINGSNAPITVKIVHNRKGENFTKNHNHKHQEKSPQVLRKCLVRLKKIHIEATNERSTKTGSQQSETTSENIPEIKRSQNIIASNNKLSNCPLPGSGSNRGDLNKTSKIVELTSRTSRYTSDNEMEKNANLINKPEENVKKRKVLITKKKSETGINNRKISKYFTKAIENDTLPQKIPNSLKKCSLRRKKTQIEIDFIRSTTTHNQKEITSENIREMKLMMMESTPLPELNEERRKNLKKLSLNFISPIRKKKTPINLIETTDLEVLQGEAIQGSSICFQPLRNSTSIETDLTKNRKAYGRRELNNIREDSALCSDNTNENNESTEFDILRGSLNKSKEAEQQLPDLREDQGNEMSEIFNNNKNSNENYNPNKINKFFHRSVNVSNNNAIAELNKDSPKIMPRNRNSLSQVYDFVNLSQSADSNNPKRVDPAEDIIKKLIAEGKVRVATNWKGKGKTIIKRAPAKRIKKKRLDNAKTLRKANARKINEQRNTKRVENNNRDIEEYTDDFDYEPLTNQSMKEMLNQQKRQRICRPSGCGLLKEGKEGTFSRLAQSVLLKQTTYSPLQNEKNRQLLRTVQKIISTPKAPVPPSIANCSIGTDLSPVAFPGDATKSYSPLQNEKNRQLLQTVQKIVSTPKAPVPPSIANYSIGTDLSPIAFTGDATKSYSPLQNEKNRQLLQTVQKIVSIPKAPVPPSIANYSIGTDLSPIAFTGDARKSSSRTGQNSPWRVDENIYLPTIFNFSRNSDNLPSFSSDVIPPTPRKNTSKHHYHNPSINNSLENSSHITNLEREQENSMPSFSSNDSNAENIPPPKSPQNNRSTMHITNENIYYNLRQATNPRQTLSNRSPLNTIEILEVIQLPLWKKPLLPDKEETSSEKDKSIDFDVERLSHTSPENEENYIEELSRNISEDTNVLSENVQNNRAKNNKSILESSEEKKISIFGFEEYLIESESDITNNLTPQYSKRCEDKEINENNNKTLHDKLQELHNKWLPKEIRSEKKTTIQKEQEQNSKNQRTPIFDDQYRGFKDFRQRNIKHMLCSTMIQSSNSPQAMKRLNSEKHNSNIKLDELFMDPAEGSAESHDQSHHHRTYLRNRRRVRRRFVHFESDKSENESDDDNNKKVAEQKRTKHQPKKYKANSELKQFVKEFNAMCEEVEQYELVVEKQKEDIDPIN